MEGDTESIFVEFTDCETSEEKMAHSHELENWDETRQNLCEAPHFLSNHNPLEEHKIRAHLILAVLLRT